jgi:hypothetical protein
MAAALPAMEPAVADLEMARAAETVSSGPITPASSAASATTILKVEPGG